MNDFITETKKALGANGLDEFLAGGIPERLGELAEHLIAVNSVMNLTSITDPRGVAVRHFADSLSVSRLIPAGARVIDVGCGAGFPSLPLAVARPDLDITALDSTGKRINFLNETAELFGIGSLHGIAARAEDAGREPGLRESFDVAVSRAVARMNILSELCLPFVRCGGVFIAMKGDPEEELSEALAGIAKLGGGATEKSSFDLLGEDEPERRTLVSVKKLSATPNEYPRDFARIKKKPL